MALSITLMLTSPFPPAESARRWPTRLSSLGSRQRDGDASIVGAAGRARIAAEGVRLAVAAGQDTHRRAGQPVAQHGRHDLSALPGELRHVRDDTHILAVVEQMF